MFYTIFSKIFLVGIAFANDDPPKFKPPKFFMPKNAANILFIIINNIFLFLFTIFGAFAVIMFIIAGFMYLTAAGDTTKIETANKAIIWGAVGVGVGALAFIIPNIILGILR